MGQVLDFDSLLAPIGGENSAGEALRYAPVYDEIKEARREDDNLVQGDWKTDAKVADWPKVIASATEALCKKSKDLQIAVWLTEAVIKREGFDGLRDGLRLLRELQEKFWPTLYPVIEDGDSEFRAAPIIWVNEKLPFTIKGIPLTPAKDGLRGYSWFDWQKSRTDTPVDQQPPADGATPDDRQVTREKFDKAVASAPRAFFESLNQALIESSAQCDQLARVVDEKFGKDPPSLLEVKKALEDCRSLTMGIVKQKRELEPDAVPTDGASAESASGATAGGDSSAAVRDRADALRRLAAIAAYLQRTEPHSPVSYLVQRAVKWGQMPLDHWLKDVINDQNVLAHVRETLGLTEPVAGETKTGEGNQ